MTRISSVVFVMGALLAGTLTGAAHVAHASCGRVEPKAVTIDVDTCTKVDETKVKASGYAGVLLKGTLDDGKTRKKDELVWVPESEGLVCKAITATTVIAGTLDFACCDGDPNPPCLLETSARLGKLIIGKKPTPKPAPAPAPKKP